MNSEYTRSDLAGECRPDNLFDRHGFLFSEKKERGFSVSFLDIYNKEGAQAIGKAQGKYITITVGKIWHASDSKFKECSELICEHIGTLSKSLIGRAPDNICIVGLGNRYITSDAIGHEVVKNIIVTRHLKEFDRKLYSALGGKSVCALTPGVIGQTGIETLELIQGSIKKIKPDILIVIDALVAKDLSRLATTVQITDAGIAPGSGIGNTRHAINFDSVGCPVIAIGVPTVVESSTLVYNALEKAGIQQISPALKTVLENGRGFFVTLKDSDTVTLELSRLIADALNSMTS